MDGNWFVIAFFMIVVGIPVLAGVLGKLGSKWLKLKEKQLELATHEAADKAASQAVHIEKLEARMRVLERIATDKSSDLAAEIEDLRSIDPLPPRSN